MTAKSISAELIHTHTSDNTDDRMAVEIFARKKKIGTYRPVPYADFKEKQKDLGKLARAGFSYDIAMSVFNDRD